MTNHINYLRVTQVLFPFSGLTHVNDLILKNAAARGTKVHQVCEALINNIGVDEENLDENISKYVESFKPWMSKNFIDRPQRFFCNELQITGECDGIYKDGDDLVLFDLKTSANESKTWRLQGSAYAYLARKAGYDIKRIEFIKLLKTGKPAKVFVYEENFDLFLRCLELYKEFFLTTEEVDYLDFF